MDGVHYHYGFDRRKSQVVPKEIFRQAVEFHIGHPRLIVYPLRENQKIFPLRYLALISNLLKGKLPFYMDGKVVYKKETDFPPEWGQILNFENSLEMLHEDILGDRD